MDSNKGIPAEVFAKMVQEASALFENGEFARVFKIEQQIREVGYSFIVRDGGLRLVNNTTPQAAEDIPNIYQGSRLRNEG